MALPKGCETRGLPWRVFLLRSRAPLPLLVVALGCAVLLSGCGGGHSSSPLAACVQRWNANPLMQVGDAQVVVALTRNAPTGCKIWWIQRSINNYFECWYQDSGYSCTGRGSTLTSLSISLPRPNAHEISGDGKLALGVTPASAVLRRAPTPLWKRCVSLWNRTMTTAYGQPLYQDGYAALDSEPTGAVGISSSGQCLVAIEAGEGAASSFTGTLSSGYNSTGVVMMPTDPRWHYMGVRPNGTIGQ